MATLLVIALGSAYAQLAGTDTLPGDSCAGYEQGASRLVADAYLNGKQITLICNGTTWQADSGGAGGGNQIADTDGNTSVKTDVAGDGSGNAILFTANGDEIAFFSSNGDHSLMFNPVTPNSDELAIFPQDVGGNDYFTFENYADGNGWSSVQVGLDRIRVFGAGGAGAGFIPGEESYYGALALTRYNSGSEVDTLASRGPSSRAGVPASRRVGRWIPHKSSTGL